jgi:DNA-directed RNA polymerase subunit M/transcription elongation factor TFIIS
MGVKQIYMKICIKKIYCPTCQRLVKAKEDTANANLRVVCPKCKNTIWTKEGLAWRYIPVAE